ncbi:MAG: flavodoxin family protein, partial [Methanosarcinales archaeon]
MKVLGVSGSPTPNSTTDTIIKAILDATGVETEFVKLSDINVGPCRACLKCTYTNKCVLKDDWNELAEKVAESDALVVGSPTYYGNVSAFTKAFMERLYAFRHINLLTRGKLAASVGV